MCIQTALQSKIAELTDNGDTILRFLADTAHGAIPGAKLCHRLDAAKTLAKYGLPLDSDGITNPVPLDGLQEPPCSLRREGRGQDEQDEEYRSS